MWFLDFFFLGFVLSHVGPCDTCHYFSSELLYSFFTENSQSLT